MNRAGPSTSYQDLIAWQRAMELVDLVYHITVKWPQNEQYGLSSQVRRAVVSIAANIAEGQGRNGRREFVHHLGIAFGSLCEVETLVMIGTRQGFHDHDRQQTLLSTSRDVGRLINGLINSMRSAEQAARETGNGKLLREAEPWYE
jgi:four helix bundle protein